MAWYRLLDDIDFPDRWQLDEPQSAAEDVDAWDFTTGVVWKGEGALSTPAEDGVALDFTLGAFGVPYVSKRMAEVFAPLEAVQLVPVTIRDRAWFILNVISVVDCIDECESVFTKWTPQDGRSDKVGQYRMVAKLRLNESRASGNRIFRLTGWDVPIIVDGDLVAEIKKIDPTGPRFELLA